MLGMLAEVDALQDISVVRRNAVHQRVDVILRQSNKPVATFVSLERDWGCERAWNYLEVHVCDLRLRACTRARIARTVFWRYTSWR
jgi:hypothetical protein